MDLLKSPKPMLVDDKSKDTISVFEAKLQREIGSGRESDIHSAEIVLGDCDSTNPQILLQEIS